MVASALPASVPHFRYIGGGRMSKVIVYVAVLAFKRMVTLCAEGLLDFLRIYVLRFAHSLPSLLGSKCTLHARWHPALYRADTCQVTPLVYTLLFHFHCSSGFIHSRPMLLSLPHHHLQSRHLLVIGFVISIPPSAPHQGGVYLGPVFSVYSILTCRPVPI